MTLLSNKKYLFLTYGFFALWVIVVYLLNHFGAISALTLTLTLFVLIFLPGFCLSRIIKIKNPDAFLDQIVLWMAVGFIFVFLICFVTIILGLTLPILTTTYFVVSGLLFLMAFIIDWRGSLLQQPIVHFNLREFFVWRNLAFFLLLVFIILILITVSQTGANFKGDPLTHLSILRKVIENQPLTVSGLSYIKFLPRLPYVFPVWHVFLGMITKIMGTNIFSFWLVMPVPLSILVLTTWYWLFKKILPSREMACLALFLFIIYYWQIIFAFDQYGYMFARLPVPDTLAQLLLLPLSLGLAIRYIFEKGANYKDLLVVSLLVIAIAMVHFTQYFYFLTTMIFFAAGFSILKYRDPEYKILFRKILLTIFTNIIIVLPFLVFLQFPNKILSKAFDLYFNVKNKELEYNFARYDLFTKLAFVFLPLTLLFIKKYRKISFIFILLIIIPIVYLNPVEVFLGKILSFVFIKRLYNSLGWPFVIWALVLGFLLILIDRLLSKLGSFSRHLRLAINIILGIAAFILIQAEVRFKTVSVFYSRTVFSKNNVAWLVENHLYLISAFTVLAIIILLLWRYSDKISTFFDISDSENKVSNFLLFFILIFFLASPSLAGLGTNFTSVIAKDQFFSRPNDPTLKLAEIEKVGGEKTVDFIKKNIPPKSVFDSNSGYFVLPLLVDVHMSDYNSKANSSYGQIYLDNINIDDKLSCLKRGKIDYILLFKADEQTTLLFNRYPQYFTKIYEQNAIIYQVNKTKVNLTPDSEISCRSDSFVP